VVTAFQAFQLEDLERELSESDKPYLEFLRRRGMSGGLYRLPVGAEDRQHPHAADEMYYVLRGRGTLRVRDHDVAVGAGSVVSVDHGEDHRFVDIAEDLHRTTSSAPRLLRERPARCLATSGEKPQPRHLAADLRGDEAGAPGRVRPHQHSTTGDPGPRNG
jgi:quercetin dioxygenase-like cupin family protein